MLVQSPYFYVLLTVALTVYGQLITKWQAGNVGPTPDGLTEGAVFLLRLAFSPWMVSAYAAAFLGSLSWIVALRKLPLSSAFPFVALTFVLVIGAGALLFDEELTQAKLIGSLLIVCGVLVVAMS